MVVPSWSRVSAFEGRDNKDLFQKMREVEFFETFVEDYTQGELLTVNKEEVRRPIWIRFNIGVKITNEGLN